MLKYLKNSPTLRLHSDLCTGCGDCVDVCPRAVLEIREKRVAITELDLCMECGACQTNCAYGAITVDAGVGCASALIHGMLTGGEACCGGPDGCC